MPLFLKSLDPLIEIFGNEQTLKYNADQLNNGANLILFNDFIPKDNISSLTNLIFTNPSLKGFQFQHELSDSSVFGNFSFKTYDKFGISTDIFKYDELTDSFNFLKNVNFQSFGISNDLSLNTHKITDLANGEIETDAINLGQLNSAISNIQPSTINFSGAITGSGTGNIDTKLSSVQTMDIAQLTFDWSNSTVFDGKQGIINKINDTTPYFMLEATDSLFQTHGQNYESTTLFLNPFIKDKTDPKVFSINFRSLQNLVLKDDIPFSISVYYQNLNTNLYSIDLLARINLNDSSIINLSNPTNNNDAANKIYVDTHTWTSSQITDFTSSVRTNKPTDLALITSSFNVNSNKIINLSTPTNNNDAVNKDYADSSTVNTSRLSGFPNSSTLFLNGSGLWSAPQIGDITTSSIDYKLSINNTNTSATNTEIMFKRAGSNRLAIGTNNSLNGSYIMAYSSPIKIGVDDIIGAVFDGTSWDFGNKDIVTTGTINAKTNTLRANNIGTFNSTSLVCENQIDMVNKKIINVATPTNSTDVANKDYVDSIGVATLLQGSNTTGRKLIAFRHNVTLNITSGNIFQVSLPSAYRNSVNEILFLDVLGPSDADNLRSAYGGYTSNIRTLSYGMDSTGRYVQIKCTTKDIEAGSIITAVILGVV